MSDANYSSSREFGKRQQETHRRDLLVLIYHHLMGEGFLDSAGSLRDQLQWDVGEFSLCDNVDLSLILMDFCCYFQMRFHRKPKITKRNPELKSSSEVKVPRPKRPPAAAQLRQREDEELENHHPLQITSYDNNTNPPLTHRTITIPKELLMNEETRDLALQLSREFITQDSITPTTWNDVSGHEEVKRCLEETVILPLRHPDLFRQSGLGGQGTRGILLAGPPGTGKTLLARALASQCGSNFSFLSLNASSLASRWRGESEKMARAAFDLARHNAPAVVFVDEVDSVLGERGAAGEHEASRRFKSEFLVQLDGLTSSKDNDQDQHQVLFLASTNMPWSLDPALLRRFQRVFHLGLPNSKERLEMIQRNLKDVKIEKGFDFDYLVKVTEDCSGSEISRCCENAKRILFRRMVERRSNNNKVSSLVLLSLVDLKEAFKDVSPEGGRWKMQCERGTRMRNDKKLSANMIEEKC